MAVILVTYDLMAPGQKYSIIKKYIEDNYTWCKGLESVWLLDTDVPPKKIREDIVNITDSNDKIFVVKITQQWSSWNYYCADWLNASERNW